MVKAVPSLGAIRDSRGFKGHLLKKCVLAKYFAVELILSIPNCFVELKWVSFALFGHLYVYTFFFLPLIDF